MLAGALRPARRPSRMKQLHFFTLRPDILSVLDLVERDMALQYVPMVNAPGTMPAALYRRGADIPQLGQATHASSIACDSYLVAPAHMPVLPRTIREVTGSPRTCIDQLLNPHTVALTPAGLWGADAVIAGSVGAASPSTANRELMRRFSAAFRSTSTKVKAYWVGHEAMQLLKAGKRLTASAESPRDYDLRIE